MEAREVRIPGPVGTLQGIRIGPARGAVGAIVMHPHPKFGGSMHNNVVDALASALAEALIPVLVFNFRGVGKSQGSSSWRGADEGGDVRAAVRFLMDDCKCERVVPVGYSFSSSVLGSVVQDLDAVHEYVLVAPPWGWTSSVLLGHLYAPLKTCTKRVMLIIGDNDNFCGLSRFHARVDGIPGAPDEGEGHKGKEVHVLAGADHFFMGLERRLAALVVSWVAAIVQDTPRK